MGIVGAQKYLIAQPTEQGVRFVPVDLKMAVYLELTEVLTYGASKKDYGTSAACNPYSYPAPAVGVRN